MINRYRTTSKTGSDRQETRIGMIPTQKHRAGIRSGVREKAIIYGVLNDDHEPSGAQGSPIANGTFAFFTRRQHDALANLPTT